MKALKTFIKPCEAPQRSVKIKPEVRPEVLNKKIPKLLVTPVLVRHSSGISNMIKKSDAQP